MATQTWDKPLIAEEGETITLTGAGGTLYYLAFKPRFDGVIMWCDTAWRRALSPALVNCLLYDTGLTTYTSYRTEATDGLAATHVPLDAMGTDDYFYMGFSEPALGVKFDIGTNVQDEAASLDVEYCSTAVAQGATIAFTDVAGDSDGTDSAGDTLKQDGAYTWTLPSAWKRSTLGTYAAPLYQKCYWIRFKPSATLDAATDINEIIPIYQNTNYSYMEASTSYIEQLNTTKNGGFVMHGTEDKVIHISWLRHG